MTPVVPEGYLGAQARITSGPAAELVEAGYALELADAPLLHHGLGLADLAHVIALREAGVIPEAEGASLLTVLLDTLATPAEAFPYDAVYGDAYNSRERELERRLGRVAGWLHTGRTRREAGRIAFRVAMREHVLALHETTGRFVSALAEQAAAQSATVWADTTYLQPAQPSTFGHYLGGFGEEAARHLGRLEAVHRWADRSPAGVGGVAGTRVPVDRHRLAALLGFAAPGAHTRDVMWSVDGLADAAMAATQAATTVDRLAEDLEIFASPGFGYVALDASLCRASVLLPQKRNPYALAVIRSGAGTLIGRTTGLLVTQRSPSARTDNWLHAYGEVAGALELARRVVSLGAEVVATVRVDRTALATAAGAHFTGATDLAEELVLRHGLDYRSAYRVVGRAVATATEAGQSTLDAADLACAAAQVLDRDLTFDPGLVADAQDPVRCALHRSALGGSAPDRVREHCRALAERVGVAENWRRERQAAADAAEAALVATARRLARP
ncbi:argininosuccinate lyase (plasmid) [Mycolicibacterium chubuense NBB4]|uniref:argininosuccinate lyase n=1 Tax=Mycolicibacterium chubuense (strain NBB4) TaxID=710421 RepID=I4BS63_MYCCN|nr:lyase family protein [Mycolicibacterium chubuense]AFM20120.1 argininosuccinate lyase [Mycolicibacterium chubuense NBB4]